MTLNRTLVCLASIFVTINAASAGVVGTSVQIMDFSNGYILADGSIHAPSVDAVRCAWYADAGRRTVWRFWVHVDNPADIINGFGSSPSRFLWVSANGSGFFNHPLGSATPPNAALMENVGDLAFDSFLTVGNAATSGPGLDSILFMGDLQGYTLEENFTMPSQNAGWQAFGPFQPGQGLVPAPNWPGTWRILLAQLTFNTGDAGSMVGTTISTSLKNIPVEFCGLSGCGSGFDDCNLNGMNDLVEVGLGITPDLNANLNPDDCDIASGISFDCNGNFVPDEIDLFRDCAPIHPDGSVGDGAVDINDLIAVLNNFGIPGGPCDVAPHPCGNGVVNIDDLVIVLNSFGPCP